MPSDASLLNPHLKILVDGKPLTPEIEADLVSALVSEDLESPSMFELQLVTWDLVKQEMTWVDDKVFDIGNEVEIQIGYEQEIKTIMVGEITGLEPEYTQDVTPILVVRGHDLRHRLLRGRHTKSFLKMKDSDIASQIARTRGLTAKATDSKVKLEYILQHNQTDWEFLQERAGRIGYEVVVDNKTLYFRPHENAKAKILTLTYGEDLQEFLPRLSTLGQIQQLEVRGWIPKDKKEVISNATIGKEGGTMGGSTSGTKAVKKAFGKSSHTIVNQLVSSKAEADQMALGQFQDRSLAYISGEGTGRGNPDLRAGKVIEIAGVGKRFSGLYYMTNSVKNWLPLTLMKTKMAQNVPLDLILDGLIHVVHWSLKKKHLIRREHWITDVVFCAEVYPMGKLRSLMEPSLIKANMESLLCFCALVLNANLSLSSNSGLTMAMTSNYLAIKTPCWAIMDKRQMEKVLAAW